MQEEWESKSRNSQDWGGWRVILPLALVLAAFGLGEWNAYWRAWNRLDELPEQWDEAHFTSMSIRLNDMMRQDPAKAYDYFVHGSPNQAPLTPLAASFLYYVRPRTVQTALDFNTLCLAVILVSVYFLGACRSVLTGALAAVTAACMMPMVQYMRLSRTELPLAAWVALIMLCINMSERFKQFVPALAAGILCGVAMLTNPIALVFLLAPALYALIRGLAESKFSGFRLLNFAVGLIAAFVIFSVWYLPNQEAIRQFLLGYGFGAQGAAYRVTHPDPLFYPRMLFQDLGWPIFVAVFVAIVFAIVSRLAAKAEGVANRRELDLWLIVVWVVAAYLVLNLPSDQETRFLLPLLPGAAVLLAVLITSIRWKWALAGAAALLALACAGGLYAAFSQPLTHIREVDITKGHNWQLKEIALAIAEDSRGKPGKVAFLANHALFTAKGFDLTALLEGHDFDVIYVGEVRTEDDKKAQVANCLTEADYAIFKKGAQMEASATHLDIPMPDEDKLRLGGYKFMAGFTLPDGTEARLYKRQHR
jgi:hypothetical protein